MIVVFLAATPFLCPAQESSILQKRVTLALSDVMLDHALDAISEQASCTFSYSGTYLNTNRKISLHVQDVTVKEVLKQLIGDAAERVKVQGSKIQIIAQAEGRGHLRGSVKTSDGKPGEFVNVTIRGTGKGTQTNEKGEFVIKNISVGEHTVIVQLLGYEPIESVVQIVKEETVVLPAVFLNEDNKILQEVIVTGNKDSYKRDMPSQSLRIQSPIMETPQNIIVISSELLKDQQIFTTTDVARNVSGVTTLYPYINTYTDFAIRGTRATNNKMRNGVSTTIPYLGIEEDMSYVENIEFIKGPAGFMLSQGEPGGMYNVVTKKPLRRQQQSVELSTGSFGLFRASTDVTGPLGKKLFYRVNLMGRKSGTQIDFSENNRFSIAPVLRYEFDEKTSFTFEYNGDFVGLKGVDPTISSVNGGKFLPRNFAVEDPATPLSTLKSHYGLAVINHTMNAKWNVTAQISAIRQISDRKNMTSRAAVTDAGLLDRQYRESYLKGNTLTAQVFLNGSFNTGFLNHKLMIGYDGAKQEASGSSVFISGIFPLDVNNPQYRLNPQSFDTLNIAAATSYNAPSTVSWQAVYLQDVISPVSWLQLTLAGRYTYYSFGSPKLQKEHVFTPRFGLVLTPIANTTVYALYDRAFIAQAGQTFDKRDFKPLKGNNMELGIKREWFSKKLFTQVAYFNIIKQNALTADPVNTGFSIQQGEVQSKGVEVDILGNVTKNFNVMANYAYTDVQVTADTDPSVVGSRQQSPLHTFNTWIRYKVLSGDLKGLGLGLGYSHYAKRNVLAIKKVPTDLNYTTLPDFKSLNAALYYNIGKLAFALNLDNITNAFNVYGYFDRRNGTGGEFYYMSMPGANFRISVGYRF